MKKEHIGLLWVMGIIMSAAVCLPANVYAFKALHGDMGELTSSVNINYKPVQTDMLRVYIPPGTLYASVKVYCVNDATGMKTVSRFAKAPAGYGTTAPSYVPGGSTVEELRFDNRFATNTDGLIKVIEQRIATPLSADKAGWLYMRILGGLDAVYSVKVRIDVDPSVYNAWYKTISWATNVDTPCAAAGNCVASSGTPTPSPSPTPSPTPSPCDPAACAAKGGKCENNKCMVCKEVQ